MDYVNNTNSCIYVINILRISFVFPYSTVDSVAWTGEGFPFTSSRRNSAMERELSEDNGNEIVFDYFIVVLLEVVTSSLLICGICGSSDAISLCNIDLCMVRHPIVMRM